MCCWTHFFAGSGAALNSASTCDHMRDVVADMARQNLGAPLNVGMLIPNESPEMCKGDDFMSQRPDGIATLRLEQRSIVLILSRRHFQILLNQLPDIPQAAPGAIYKTSCLVS
jgi:hypothetical protein